MDMLSTPTTWATEIEQWEQWMRAPGRAESTRYLRTYHLRRLGHDHPNLTPRTITYDHLIVWMAGKDWKPQTRRGYRSSLRQFFAWMHATGRTPVNVAYELPTISVPRSLPRPAPDQVVLDAVARSDARTRLMIVILTETGIRRGELAKIHTTDVEPDLTGWSLRVLGKGGRERVVPLSDPLARVIRRMPPGYLFPGQIGGHLSPAHCGVLVSRSLDDGWTAHKLRHRFATFAYDLERDIRAVQELLGHANIQTTTIYTLVPKGAMRRAAAAASLGIAA